MKKSRKNLALKCYICSWNGDVFSIHTSSNNLYSLCIMRCMGHVFIESLKKTLDSLRKHLIHKRKQLHKVVNRRKSDSKYTAYKAQSSALHENKLLYWWRNRKQSYCEENPPTEFSTSSLFRENARSLKLLLLLIQLPAGKITSLGFCCKELL